MLRNDTNFMYSHKFWYLKNTSSNSRGFSQIVSGNHCRSWKTREISSTVSRASNEHHRSRSLHPQSLVLFINVLLTRSSFQDLSTFILSSWHHFNLGASPRRQPLYGDFRPSHRIIFGNYLRYLKSKEASKNPCDTLLWSSRIPPVAPFKT